MASPRLAHGNGNEVNFWLVPFAAADPRVRCWPESVDIVRVGHRELADKMGLLEEYSKERLEVPWGVAPTVICPKLVHSPVTCDVLKMQSVE